MSGRFLRISADVLHRTDLKAEAILFYFFLVDEQTSADGWVFYGKPVGYAWIQKRFLRCSESYLQKHMRALKRAGLVQVERIFHGGIRIRLPLSIKFAKQIPAAVQMSMFAPPVTEIRRTKAVENPVEKLWKSSESPILNNVPQCGIEPHPSAAERSTDSVSGEKLRGGAASAVAIAEENPDDLARLLRESIDQVERRKAKNAG